MAPDVETVVIGAGAVGLAIARALAAAGHEVMVIERHTRVGAETTSRSSEVIHAGLYYEPGSLKARLCVDGRHRLYAFASEHGIPHVRYGKLLVATEEGELPALEAVAKRAAANGVDDLVRMSAADVRSLEPEVACIAAYFSPSTGVVDSHALVTALEGEVQAAGGSVVLGTEVEQLSAEAGLFVLATTGGEQGRITTRNLVIAAGHGASRLGAMLPARPGYVVPKTYPARGHYFALEGRPPFSHLVYPMPSGAWLGVHLTLDTAGRAKFGPDLEWQDEVSYAFDEAGGRRREGFEREIRRYWPGLPAGSLVPGYVGVRPKIYRQGEPAPDFAIHGEDEHGIARLVALYGIESPGLTSSLAIGDAVAALLPRA
jgi:L-2-hydroxyglutarate oxidase LhgO